MLESASYTPDCALAVEIRDRDALRTCGARKTRHDAPRRGYGGKLRQVRQVSEGLANSSPLQCLLRAHR